MGLKDQLEELEYLKLMDPSYRQKLKRKALKMILEQDQEQGEGWSDDSSAIADMMVRFYIEVLD